jgi:hypothetical protein
MKAAKISAMVLGAVVLAYFILISFIPESTIVGIHWGKR